MLIHCCLILSRNSWLCHSITDRCWLASCISRSTNFSTVAEDIFGEMGPVVFDMERDFREARVMSDVLYESFLLLVPVGVVIFDQGPGSCLPPPRPERPDH